MTGIQQNCLDRLATFCHNNMVCMLEIIFSERERDFFQIQTNGLCVLLKGIVYIRVKRLYLHSSLSPPPHLTTPPPGATSSQSLSAFCPDNEWNSNKLNLSAMKLHLSWISTTPSNITLGLGLKMEGLFNLFGTRWPS